MHKSEKWKWSHSVVSDSQRPHGLQPTRLLHPWIFQARVLEWGAIAFSDGGSKLFSFSKNLKKNKRPYKWTYLQNRNGCTGLENKFLVTKGKGREKVLAAQSYPTLCHPLDCSPPVSSVHRIFQAKILEWVTMPLSTYNFIIDVKSSDCKNVLPEGQREKSKRSSVTVRTSLEASLHIRKEAIFKKLCPHNIGTN